jgi:hypothetical protein
MSDDESIIDQLPRGHQQLLEDAAEMQGISDEELAVNILRANVPEVFNQVEAQAQQ